MVDSRKNLFKRFEGAADEIFLNCPDCHALTHIDLGDLHKVEESSPTR
jgi:hypothetical protein